MFNQIIDAAKRAGDILLELRDPALLVDYKVDQSPVTIADKKSSEFLTLELKSIKDLPVLSEENLTSFEERQLWQDYWMIDPLDGTKEYIKNQSEFCVNITYMKNNEPVIGVIYAPVLQELHAAIKGEGTFHQNVRMKTRSSATQVAVSRFHHSDMTKQFLEDHNYTETVCVGASLKFGRMAVGQIDIYPRFQGSSEWDIAAGHLILTEAGGKIIDLTTNLPPLYNKESFENNFFIASRPGFL